MRGRARFRIPAMKGHSEGRPTIGAPFSLHEPGAPSMCISGITCAELKLIDTATQEHWRPGFVDRKCSNSGLGVTTMARQTKPCGYGGIA
jgi:hypothetical protein